MTRVVLAAWIGSGAGLLARRLAETLTAAGAAPGSVILAIVCVAGLGGLLMAELRS